MSGCLIVQLTYDKLDEKNRLDENEFLSDDCGYTGNGFLDTVGDSVSESEDYEGDVKWFLEMLGDGVVYNKEDNSIGIVDKDKIFSEEFEAFQNMVKNMTLKDFMSSSKVFQMEELLNDKFGLYIYQDYWQTKFDFFRDCLNGEKLYIGGILHYHY